MTVSSGPEERKILQLVNKRIHDNLLKQIIIHSTYLPDSDWLKAMHNSINQLLMTKFGRILCLTRSLLEILPKNAF